MADSLIDPSLFDQLKTKIEEDSKIRQDLSDIVEILGQQVAFTQGLLSRVHSTPRSQCRWSHSHSFVVFGTLNLQIDPTFLQQVGEAVAQYHDTVSKLSKFASQQPYYK